MEQKLLEILRTSNTILQSNDEGSPIKYTIINPADFTIKISTNTGFLTFKQNYSPYWNMDGANPVVANYFGNGYFNFNKGEIKLLYLPQKLYAFLLTFFKILLFSIIISITTIYCFNIYKNKMREN